MIVRTDPWSSPSDVTPEGFDVRTKVHEYGGGSFLVSGSTVYFAEFADQRLYRQDLGGVPVPRARPRPAAVTATLMVAPPPTGFFCSSRSQATRVTAAGNELVALRITG